MLIIVGSQNPVKIQAVQKVFKKVFKKVTVKGKKVSSGVSCQPMSFETAFQGALTRAKQGFLNYKQAAFSVGIEGGLQKYSFGWTTAGVTVILDKKQKIGVAISAQLRLPEEVVRKIKAGKELGLVMEDISGEKNIKQKEGAFGYFSHNLVTREQAYIQAVSFSLSHFLKRDL